MAFRLSSVCLSVCLSSVSLSLSLSPFLPLHVQAPKNSFSDRETELYSGLFAQHAYSITGVRLIELSEEEPEVNGSKRLRLVRVRNPYGDEKEWKLDWADK